MDVVSYRTLEPFTTKDGSTIREYLHSPAQSLAEATLEPGQSTMRHYHALSEEIYLLIGGGGTMEIDGETREVGRGRRDPDPAGRVARAAGRGGRRAVAVLLRAAVLARRHVFRVRSEYRRPA